MDIFFTTSPLFFLLFIPAISMRVFTEEYTSGTIETLVTKPIYVVSIYYLGESVGNLDLAGIMGSYLGLIFL